MMNQETPLRGEVSDIGYSILDGVDGVVLGDTTAEGLYGE
jgi:pyruvate kinase